MRRVKRSFLRKFHQPIEFLAAVDLAFREEVLSEAFQAGLHQVGWTISLRSFGLVMRIQASRRAGLMSSA